MGKRIRSANYGAHDVDTLMDICLRYKNILEDKRSTPTVNQSKADAWKEITAEYCKTCEPRSTASLREKYDGLRRFLKKHQAYDMFAAYDESNCKVNIEGSNEDHDGRDEPKKKPKPLALTKALTKYAEVLKQSNKTIRARTVSESERDDMQTRSNIKPSSKAKSKYINYSTYEVDSLIEICLRYTDILEDKRINAALNLAKANIWKEVTAEYCKKNEQPRSTVSLREKYDGLRRTILKRQAYERLQCKADSDGSDEDYDGGCSQSGKKKPKSLVLTKTLKKFAEILKQSMSNYPARTVSESGLQEDSFPIRASTRASSRTKRKYTNNTDSSNDFAVADYDGGSSVFTKLEKSLPAQVAAESDNASTNARPFLGIRLTRLKLTDSDTPINVAALNDTTVDDINLSPVPVSTDAVSTSAIGAATKLKTDRMVSPTMPQDNIDNNASDDALMMAQQKHKAVMADLAATKKRAFAQHVIAVANMRLSARRERRLNSIKMTVQLHKKKQQQREHKYRMRILKAELATAKLKEQQQHQQQAGCATPVLISSVVAVPQHCDAATNTDDSSPVRLSNAVTAEAPMIKREFFESPGSTVIASQIFIADQH